ncbi:hypothetical protein ABT160_27240 [Streptomyces sp. NPDC001941]|uniref:hypothetical protein n=1 Tax=Streptomyces sp. NPDC001941 TaxID=3154659 RepID=UPI003332B4C6
MTRELRVARVDGTTTGGPHGIDAFTADPATGTGTAGSRSAGPATLADTTRNAPGADRTRARTDGGLT